MTKLLAVLFSYCEVGRLPKLRIKNLNFFLKHGLILDGSTDYYFLINGHKLSVNIPKHDNIKIIFRDNKNYDFGAYSELLLKNNFTEKYDFFMFINDSVRGPFMYDWTKKLIDWRYVFIQLLDNDTKIVGPTINNYNGKAHVNSECFMLDKKGMLICIEKKIFSNKQYDNIGLVCQDCEVRMSQVILDKGYNIASLMLCYKGIDFRKYRNNKSLNVNIRKSGDPLYNNKYHGINLNPYETIFFKSNRKVAEDVLSNYTDWINA